MRFSDFSSLEVPLRAWYRPIICEVVRLTYTSGRFYFLLGKQVCQFQILKSVSMTEVCVSDSWYFLPTCNSGDNQNVFRSQIQLHLTYCSGIRYSSPFLLQKKQINFLLAVLEEIKSHLNLYTYWLDFLSVQFFPVEQDGMDNITSSSCLQGCGC